jgi:hypothetical protein
MSTHVVYKDPPDIDKDSPNISKDSSDEITRLKGCNPPSNISKDAKENWDPETKTYSTDKLKTTSKRVPLKDITPLYKLQPVRQKPQKSGPQHEALLRAEPIPEKLNVQGKPISEKLNIQGKSQKLDTQGKSAKLNTPPTLRQKTQQVMQFNAGKSQQSYAQNRGTTFNEMIIKSFHLIFSL